MSTPNLDFVCADYGHRIGQNVEVKEALLNKAIGVLQENGVYALMLYLSSRSSKDEKAGAVHICRNLMDLLYDPRLSICNGEREDQFATTQQLAHNLDKLLFVKNLCEQTLIYGRYHRKAME
jgi:hypothetical protein